MSDLLYYSDSVIIKYKPVRVFIYEGDNDIAAGKKAEDVIWDEYLKLNIQYKCLSLSNKNIKFVDVWTPLLNKEGSPKKEIFISDSLHINKLGYDIWAGEIKKFIK